MAERLSSGPDRERNPRGGEPTAVGKIVRQYTEGRPDPVPGEEQEKMWSRAHEQGGTTGE